MSFVPSPAGDFDGDDLLNATDVDTLASKIPASATSRYGYAMFDLNGDNRVNQLDHRIWVKDLKHTWYGDANLDGEFSSGDMVQVLASGKYETNEQAGWAAGDWNADGVFDSGDLVTAFVDGGYEQGPRMDAVATIPEPSGRWLLMLAVVWLPFVRLGADKRLRNHLLLLPLLPPLIANVHADIYRLLT